MALEAEIERLAIMAEEMGEAIQIIGKILRHGYESCHPNGGPINRELLEMELGDVYFSMQFLWENEDISKEEVMNHANTKREGIKEYLHYNLIQEKKMKTFETFESGISDMKDCMKRPIVVQAKQLDEPFRVDSIEGDYKQGKAGDYLMRGVDEELYICDKAIFEKSYDWM